MTATTTVAAPVFASRDDSQAPLRVAREGSVLLLLDVDGDWCHVEFQDPEFGRRTGYVQTKYVRIGNPVPADAASAAATPASSQRLQQRQAPQGPQKAQTFAVKIIDRQNNSGSYTYVVPGYSNSTSNTNVNCTGFSSSVNCNGSTRTTGSTTPAFLGSYEVQGATLSLQLSDGRVAVVNCESKLNWTGMSVYRSCRVPLVNSIEAEFDGDKAKLKWSVSIDGKKMESETYKILAVLAK